MFKIVTVIAGVTILKLKLSLFVLSETEVAVIVGEELPEAGGVLGG